MHHVYCAKCARGPGVVVHSSVMSAYDIKLRSSSAAVLNCKEYKASWGCNVQLLCAAVMCISPREKHASNAQMFIVQGVQGALGLLHTPFVRVYWQAVFAKSMHDAHCLKYARGPGVARYSCVTLQRLQRSWGPCAHHVVRLLTAQFDIQNRLLGWQACPDIEDVVFVCAAGLHIVM
jgi:hypothetical protein